MAQGTLTVEERHTGTWESSLKAESKRIMEMDPHGGDQSVLLSAWTMALEDRGVMPLRDIANGTLQKRLWKSEY